MRRIDRVAVLGAGTMGAAIAAHLANAGLRVLLLDRVPEEPSEEERTEGLSLEDEKVRNRLARQGLESAKRNKPAAFFLPDEARRIEIGNFADHAGRLKDCDWVIEAVAEDPEIKKSLFAETVIPHLKSGGILSTNTSGLSVNELAESLPQELRRRFLGTHFFNPPRYMRLVEVVPGKDTDREVEETISDRLRRLLGKGVVHAKDTPNFVANRIGVYAIYKAMEQMQQMGLSVEEVDAVSGIATARPKTAVFRTADMVGLDILLQVGKNSYSQLEQDEERELFETPSFLQKMVQEGLLGSKAGQGFYRKEKGEAGSKIYYYDYVAGEYRPVTKPSFRSVEAAKGIEDPAERLRTVMRKDDKAAEFAWRTLRDTLFYAVRRIPEIADDVVNVDRAMRWGFNWELGPFEMLDALGIDDVVQRAEKEGTEVPEALLGVERFYRIEQGRKSYFDLNERRFHELPLPPDQIRLDLLRQAGSVVERSAECSLHDIGEGVFCLEFHSRMNAIGEEILDMIPRAVERAENEGVGLVVGNQGDNFSVGANLKMLAAAISEMRYDRIDQMVRAFQQANRSFKYARVPVVSAPFGRTLGGGCEVALHSTALVLHAETYMGMVEVGAGLIPAGGGTKEMALRAVETAEAFETDVSPFVIKYFKQIGQATVARSAAELFRLGYARRGDEIIMDRSRLLFAARQKVQSLALGYRPPEPGRSFPAPGRSVAAALKSTLWNLRRGNYLSDYDVEIGSRIASVITGGEVHSGTAITEDYLLDLEREAFLKLCGNPSTSERIIHLLKTGKPLRN